MFLSPIFVYILFVQANAPVDGAVDQNIDIILLETVDLCTEDQ